MSIWVDKWLEKMSESTVVVIGDVIEDVTVSGRLDRACEEGVPQIFDMISVKTTLGGAGNVARIVAPIVSKTILIGASDCNMRYMNDKSIVSICNKNNIDFVPVLAQDWYNQKVRFVDTEKGLVFRTDICDHECDGKERKLPKSLFKHFIQHVNLDKTSCVILSDYCKGVLTKESVLLIIKECRKHNVPVYVDTKKNSLNMFNGAMAIKINEERFKKGVDTSRLTSTLVVTRGKDIIYTYKIFNGRMPENPFIVPVPPSKNFKDAIGAGDVFTAYMALFGICKKNLICAIEDAARVASISVGHKGTYIPKVEDYKLDFDVVIWTT